MTVNFNFIFTMIKSSKIQLLPLNIKNVPIHTYNDDFTFIVNGEEFKTNRLISDLISPKICKIHLNDPTFSQFIIDTHYHGNFSHILNLINFTENIIPENEIPFISEVIEILNNDLISLESFHKSEEIGIDNIFTHIHIHNQNDEFYSKHLNEEINFISSHFWQICQPQHYEDFLKLKKVTFQRIIQNQKLQLKDEDQLLHLINYLYMNDHEYSIFYEDVCFVNVSRESIIEFLTVFDVNDITKMTWNAVSDRLKSDTKSDSDLKERYHSKMKTFSIENEFEGIVSYLYEKSKGKIEKEINIFASGINNDYSLPKTVAMFNDPGKYFVSKPEFGSWICFDFKEHRVSPTGYSIRTSKYSQVNSINPRNWVIEASNDCQSWDIIDEVNNCSYTNGPYYSHTFKVNRQNDIEYQYVRMRQTGPNWYNSSNYNQNNNDTDFNQNYMVIDSFEIYGTYN